MNFGQMKRALKRLVGRPDMTDADAGDYVQRAIANLERSPLRLGFQKDTVHGLMDGETSSIGIPPGFLELIDLFDDDRTYRLVSLGTWQKHSQFARDVVYIAQGKNYLVKPTPPKGLLVHLHYYKEADKVSVDTDENQWLQSASEAVLYTAARMAADDYQIEDGPRFQTQADREILLLQEQDTSEEWAGDMAIEPPHKNIC